VSQDGLTWTRGSGAVEGVRGEDKESDVGSMLHPNPDWWTFDTAHLGVSDVQVGVVLRMPLNTGHLFAAPHTLAYHTRKITLQIRSRCCSHTFWHGTHDAAHVTAVKGQ
jgi:hypothetical protein